MVAKLTEILKNGTAGEHVAARIENYERRYGGGARRRSGRAQDELPEFFLARKPE